MDKTTVILLLLTLVSLCDSHGVLVSPRCRGTLAKGNLDIPDLHVPHSLPDYCSHCRNAGGPGAVRNSAKGRWRPYDPLSKTHPFRTGFGMCGDKFKDPVPRDHEKGGKFGPPESMPYSAVYKSGQVVEFIVDITTAHSGIFEFFICDIGKCGRDISKKCFKQGHCRRLLRAPSSECDSGKSMMCAPIDKKHPGRWYNPCRTKRAQQLLGGKYMRYQLPKGFECADCVIQFYWMAGQMCSPPGMIDFFRRHPMKVWGECGGDSGTKGGRNPQLATCGAGASGPVPEEYWNCADVRVMGPTVGKPDIMPKKEADMELPASAMFGYKRSDLFLPPGAIERDDDHADDKHEHKPSTKYPRKTAPKRPTPTQRPKRKAHQRPKRQNSRHHSKGNNRQVRSKPKPRWRLPPIMAPEHDDTRSHRSQLESRKARSTRENTHKPKMGACVKQWGQCGGMYYKGPKNCCSTRYKCVVFNPWYSQCK